MAELLSCWQEVLVSVWRLALQKKPLENRRVDSLRHSITFIKQQQYAPKLARKAIIVWSDEDDVDTTVVNKGSSRKRSPNNKEQLQSKNT